MSSDAMTVRPLERVVTGGEMAAIFANAFDYPKSDVDSFISDDYSCFKPTIRLST